MGTLQKHALRAMPKKKGAVAATPRAGVLQLSADAELHVKSLLKVRVCAEGTQATSLPSCGRLTQRLRSAECFAVRR